jgi:hypothetical protein
MPGLNIPAATFTLFIDYWAKSLSAHSTQLCPFRKKDSNSPAFADFGC